MICRGGYDKLVDMVIVNVIIVLSLLSLMIIVHEFGHWIVARRFGFQTPVFGFGLPFGSHIKLGNWKDTEFRFHWFVLGGYVAIPELGDESNEELLKELPNIKPFKSFPVWKRACVASAGVAFNIIFAYLVCLLMVATIGPPSIKENVVITQLLDSPGKQLQGHKPNPISKNAGLKAGDLILEINHKKIKNPNQVVQIIKSNKSKEITLQIRRTHITNNSGNMSRKFEKLKIRVTPNAEGTIGIGLGFAQRGEYEKPSKNPLTWLGQAGVILIDWTLTMLIGLGIMFMNLFGIAPDGAPKIQAEDLHGIIAIVSVFSQALSIDFREIYRWTALISVNLAIINLLPIPALDGGHLLFMLIEKIRGKKLADIIQQRAIQTGFLVLLLFMFFVLFNDIKGLITGKFELDKESSDVKKD